MNQSNHPSTPADHEPWTGGGSDEVPRYAACPFCNEKWLVITMRDEDGKHFVACQCGARGPLCDGPMEAKAAWELRHNANSSAARHQNHMTPDQDQPPAGAVSAEASVRPRISSPGKKSK